MIKLLNILYTKFKDAVVAFVPLQIVWALLLIALRIIEIIIESSTHGLPKFLGKVLYMGFIKDITFILTSSFWLFSVFYVFFLLHKKIARVIYSCIAILVLLIQLILSQYFITTLVPLGGDLWSYSLADVQQTVGAAGISFKIMMFVIITIVVLIVAFTKLPKHFILQFKWASIIIAVCAVAQLFAIAKRTNQLKIKDEQSNNLAINKSYFFLYAKFTNYFSARTRY